LELSDYLAVIQRRWRIVVSVFVVILAVALAFAFRGPRSYEAQLRIAVSVGDAQSAAPGVSASRPPAGSEAPPYTYYREYYLWLASEYLADDLSEVIQSQAFARELSAYLGEPVDPSAIRDVVRVRKTHRILDVSVQAPTPERARALAEGVVATIQTKGPTYLAQLGASTGQVVTIDQPSVRSSTTSGSLIADVGLRAFLALFLALAAAFVVEYLDSTLRTGRHVQQGLGLRVLGEIPAEGR
jgi:capsular polysaccharide biosynthesis protein